MKPPRFIPAILLLALLGLASPALRAASRALIVIGLPGSSENADDFQRLAAATRQLLVTRGFPAEQVVVLDHQVTRDAILQALKPAPGDSAGDEFWLVLFGHSGTSRGGVPAFQVGGPRLTADDMKTALDALSARQVVLIGTNASGAFLPLLQNARRTVVSATAAEGQFDQPRFPDKWVDAFTENPKAPFAWIAARASELVDQEYQSSGLAETESARLADPATGAILEPPFGQNLAAPVETPAPAPDTGYLPNASDIEIKTQDPNAEWEEQPATDLTRKIMAAAKAQPNPDGYAALVLDQQLRFTVEEDRTTDQVVFHRVYIAREEAVEDWANCFLPQNPPAVTTRLQVARVIRPDGTALVFNPAQFASGAPSASGDEPGSAMVYLPNVHAGCVVELGYQTRELLDATLPHVSQAIPIQQSVPVMKSEIEVRVPEQQPFRVVLKNAQDQPIESGSNGRRDFTWLLGPLAAAEPLPGDAPPADWQVWLGISSLPSWDEFAAWYGRISNGSDVIDDSVKKTAADLAKGANTRMEKIQRAFEFVSALRYIAIELGVQGFRPRTPAEVLSNRYGDCKDKANLLVALLRCMDVDACFVLIDRGGDTDVSFPSWQFNHAICFVPKAPDAGQPADLWLDSTDSITSFGYIAPGDFGRQALVFGKEKAEFRKVAGTGSDISNIIDDWDLTQDAAGTWSGTFKRHAAGLADYALRAAFRGLSPAQRRQRIYEQLADLWPAGDLSGATVSDVSDLRNPVEVRAAVTNAARFLPRPDFPWLDAFSSPARDRPLLLNDGQQFAGTQTLRITWRALDARTIERTAGIIFKTPTVSAADYPALHRFVRDWTAALTQAEL